MGIIKVLIGGMEWEVPRKIVLCCMVSPGIYRDGLKKKSRD